MRPGHIITTPADAHRRLLINGAASLGLTVAGYASAWFGYGDRVPTIYRVIWGGSATVLFTYWAAALIVAALARAPYRLPDFFSRARFFLEIGTFLGVNGVTWLFMPYGSTALQHVTLLFSTSYCAATVLSSADQDAFTRWRIAIVMGSLALQCIILRIDLWLYLTVYLLVLCAVFLTFDRMIRQYISELDLARSAAESARDARTQFLQAATHDLGQPLQASRLFHEQALRASSENLRREAAESARNAFDAMERLLHAILDHLRLAEGRVTARPATFAVNRLFEVLAQQYSALAALEGIDLAAFQTSCKITADLALCERAMGNLIDNALRHSGAERVRLGCRVLSAGKVRLFVADDGAGLDPAIVPGLFEDYARGPDHGRGGFGLGLASARRAALAMGGRLEHEPRWTRGAQFFLELSSKG